MNDEAEIDERPALPGQLQFQWGPEPDAAPTPELSNGLTPEQGEPNVIEEMASAPPVKPEAEANKQLERIQSPGGMKSGATERVAWRRPRRSARKTATRSKKTVASKKTRKAVQAELKLKKKVAMSEKKQETAAPKKKKSAAAKRKKSASKKKGIAGKSAEKNKAPAASGKPTTSKRRTDFHEQMETISLKWGAQLPKVGFGFWKVEQNKAADVCHSAIDVGYRHLDCACDYGNEVEVGQGIAKAISDGICDREDLWVTSKLWNTYHAPEHVLPACERTLQDLGLEYLDLYLIHFPIAQRFVPFEKNYPPGWFFNPNAANPVIEEARVPVSETWQAMEELAKSGLVRNIGICNFGTSQLRDLLSYAKIRPSVLQVETHPYLTQEKLLRYCNQERIAYTAFSPLGAQSYFDIGMAKKSEAVMKNPVVANIAKATGKTPAQVLLRWGVQRGTAVIPKTSRRERMEENINIFDFKLTGEQMAAISALDQGRRFNDPGDFGEAAFNTFLPIYE